MSARETYRKLVWKDAPLFHQPFWLDAVSDKSWDAVIIEDGSEMSAYYLYATRKSISGTEIYMPELTQFLGPAYRISSKKEKDRLQQETTVLEKLCAALPDAGACESRWQTGYFNWLPFHWKGYHQRVRYTYQLSDLHDADMIRSGFSEKIVREIRKAEKVFSIKETSDTSQFHQLVQSNFRKKGTKTIVDANLLHRAVQGCLENNCGRIWCAADDNGKWAAAIFVAWDTKTAYYIIGAKDDAFGNSGAMSLLFWNSFQYLKDKVERFDFEGSMIKGVENYFRSFGSSQHMFFEITSSRSLLSKAKNTLREFRKQDG